MNIHPITAKKNIKDYEPGKELRLNVSEYKIDDKNPLFYQDMQKEWRLKAEVKCGTLGTEQVFVCKEGKGSFLIGKNSLTGDISLGFDNTAQRFFVEVIDKNEQGHRLWAGNKVVKDRWYTLEAKATYDTKKKQSVLSLNVDGQTETLTYPGKALRHNASNWVVGHGLGRHCGIMPQIGLWATDSLVVSPMRYRYAKALSATLKSQVLHLNVWKDRIPCLQTDSPPILLLP